MSMNAGNALTFRNISAGYPDRRVLHDINVRFEAGQISALIGPNGAGKSTLIRTASGVITPDTGKISINDTRVNSLDATARAKLISVIPQARNLPPAFTVREVVMMGRTAYAGWFGNFSKQDEDIVEQALQRTDAISLADRRIGELSGGEAQRVLVARAVAQQARVMLLDEPTAHLDFHYQLSVLELLRTLAEEDQLVILVAIHDLNLAARFAQHLTLLVDGRVIVDGNQHKVLQEENLSRAYQVPMKVIHPSEVSYSLVVPG